MSLDIAQNEYNVHKCQTRYLHMVDLPAGSGKTTQIREKVRQHTDRYPNDNLLAITYTNRAADELAERIGGNPHVTVCTIHSFVAKQLQPFFSCPVFVDVYREWKRNDLDEYLENPKNKERIKRYKEKFSTDSADSIRNNIKKLKYAQRPFGDLLYGLLSHDDLLDFFVLLCDRYPMFRQRIGQKYQLLIIDECQDTNPEILNTFASIARESSTSLWIYGDLMQQIFNKNERRLRDVLAQFKQVEQPIVNHRSRPRIVQMLNELYRDTASRQAWDEQRYPEGIDGDDKSVLELYISDNKEETTKHLREQFGESNPLTLVVFNRERFKQYGLDTIYSAYQDSKAYGYNSQYTVVNVLLPNHYDESPDSIVDHMFHLVRLKRAVGTETENFNEAVRLLSTEQLGKRLGKASNKTGEPLYPRDINLAIDDAKNLWSGIGSTATVEDLITSAKQKKLLDSEWICGIQEEKTYESVSKVPFEQFEKLYDLVENPQTINASTQHGVKGESHKSIIFVMEDSIRYEPRLSMYPCMAMLCKSDSFNLQYLLDLQGRIHTCAQQFASESVEGLLTKGEGSGMKFVKTVEKLFTDGEEIDQLFFKTVFPQGIRAPKPKEPTVSGWENRIVEQVRRIASAYRIFYVGCSRAESELRIVMGKSDLEELDIEESVRDKFQKFGFTVISE